MFKANVALGAVKGVLKMHLKPILFTVHKMGSTLISKVFG